MGLGEEARRAAQRLTEEEYVRVLARRDTDGLAAASLLALALDREGVDLHLTFVPEAGDAEVARLEEERPAVLLAVGCGAERAVDLARACGTVVLVDDADPAEPVDLPALTPAAAGHAGEPAVASLALVLARAVAKRNGDLAGLALAGARAAAGPAATLRGLDAEILAEAEEEKRVLRAPPMLWPTPLVDALAAGLEPFLPAFAGRARVAKRFLDDLGVDGTLPPTALGEPARAKVADAVVRRALADGHAASVPDAFLEPDLRAADGPFAGAPLREAAARLAAQADGAAVEALAHVLGRGPATAGAPDLAERALHGLLAACRAGARVAEAPSAAHVAETARRLHALDPATPAAAWAPAEGRAVVRVHGASGADVVEAARAWGGQGAGSATRARAAVRLDRVGDLLAAVGVPR